MMTRYGFRHAARMEWIKFWSVRSTWWLLASAFVVMAAAGLAVGIGYRHHVPTATVAQIVDNSLSGAVLAQLLLGALGVLTITGEYSSGTVRPTLAAVPRRGLVLAAKATVLGTVALVIGVAGSVAGFLLAQAAVAGTVIPSASLSDPTALRPVLLTGAYLAVLALVGLGLGTMLRHAGAAIGGLFGVIFVPAFIGAMFGSAAFAVLKFVPIIVLANSITTMSTAPGVLPPWAGIGVMAGYAGVVGGFGALVLTRRDA
jgi:ABC-2 type transport system permease protein